MGIQDRLLLKGAGGGENWRAGRGNEIPAQKEMQTEETIWERTGKQRTSFREVLELQLQQNKGEDSGERQQGRGRKGVEGGIIKQLPEGLIFCEERKT